MLKRLSHADDRYREIEQMLTLPEVIANNKEYQKLIKEYNRLSEIVSKYREYLKAEKEMKVKPQKNADRPKVRSLHHIDDDDDDIPVAPVKKQTETKKPAMIEKAALKEDKAEKKTEAVEEAKEENKTEE